MNTHEDTNQYTQMCKDLDNIQSPKFVVITDTFPEIRVNTPRQGGQLFAKFRKWNEPSFLAAARYCGLNNNQIRAARKEAISLGVL